MSDQESFSGHEMKGKIALVIGLSEKPVVVVADSNDQSSYVFFPNNRNIHITTQEQAEILVEALIRAVNVLRSGRKETRAFGSIGSSKIVIWNEKHEERVRIPVENATDVSEELRKALRIWHEDEDLGV